MPEPAIFATLAAIGKSATELIAAKDPAERNRLLIEFQSALIQVNSHAASLQQTNYTLAERVRELEAELGKRSNWQVEKSRYKLEQPWRGPGSVFALKEAESRGEAAHYLCTRCFNDEYKSILQPVFDKTIATVLMRCPKCKAEVSTGFRAVGQPEYAKAGNQ